MIKLLKQSDVIQDEASECGLACISYISGTFGKEIRLQELRHRYDVTTDGLSFYHLMKICAEHQLSATAVKVTAENLKEIDTPAVLLWNNCHYVVLKKVFKNKIEVMDPAVGSRFFTMEEVTVFFSGFALEISPSPNFIRDGKLKTPCQQDEPDFFSWHSFKDGIVKYRSYMVPFIILALLIQLTNIAVPKFMSLVLDEVFPKNDEEFLWLLVYIFSFVYIIQAIGSYLKIILSQRLRRAISQHEGLLVVQNLFRMELKFFNKRLPTDLLRKIKSVDVFHLIYTHGWFDIVVEVFFSAIFLMLLFMISFQLALIVSTITATMIVIRIFLLSRLKNLQYSALDAEIRRDNVLLQSIKNIISVKVNHSEHRKVNNWFSEHAEMENNRSSIERINALIQLSITTVSHIQTIVIMSVGSYSVLKGQTTVGQLISFIFYKNSFIENIQSAIEKYITLQIASVEVKRLKDICPKDNHSGDNYSSSALAGSENIDSVMLKNVSFGYSNLDENIINKINITLNAGEKLVISGPSGSGKTTILNILAGLLKPSSGEVMVNNIELNRFGLSEYQKRISILSPDDSIIDGNVMENIVYESEIFDLNLIDQCIKDADLGEVLKNLYAGVNTNLGTNGVKLSSGQQQRLMLARALYRRPQFVLLDEPTSHLDKQSAAQIINLIKKIPTMCVIISHDTNLINSFENHFEISRELK